jgi:hypothetical protein
MANRELPMTIRTMAGATLLAVLLAACAKPAPPAESAPAPASEPAAPAPSEGAAPVVPDPAAPPPNEPSTTPPPADPPAASNGPALESMQLARPSAKMSVAADVRYQLDGSIAQGQSATLHLAVVPRIANAPVQVSIKENPGLTISAGAANLQKVNSRDVYRQQFAVTRATASATQIRVLVTMEAAEGTGFGFFTIPLEGGASTQKLDSVKQR